MIKVLYINGNIMKRGGIEAFMMNYFREFDKNQIHIDFVVHGYGKGVYDDEIIAAGSKIYHVPTKSKHPIQYVKKLKKVFQEEKYDIVHSHLDAMSGWALKVAKECGVPVRIAHSHNTDHLTNNRVKRIINEYAKKQIPTYATDLFACSEMAGEWLFGANSKYKIVKNAIDISKFRYNDDVRKEIRMQLGFQDEIVLGHVGRFDYQKNQEFLIELLSKLNMKKPLYRLIFVGEGDNFETIKELAREKNVIDYCRFLGSRSDVNKIYNAFDIFVLPSRFEGLGIVAIEAQVNGLPCILSSEVPREAAICDNVLRLDLNNLDRWEEKIYSIKMTRNNENEKKISRAGYSINEEVRWLEKFYISERK